MKGNKMRNTQWMTSMLMAGVVYTGGAYAADAASAVPATVESAAPEIKTVLSDADGNALLKKNNCVACHAMDKKLVGPGFKDVAAKYRGQPDAEATLIAKVTKGGKGVWSSMSMPPQPAKPEDVDAMVKFILSRQ
ncbi:MAG: c-type cytochrome [Gallionella sp.]|jgi:cytochrome c551/c552|nr:c-type cytochrome [Gallionella sp.]